jgi:hypothetical protein
MDSKLRGLLVPAQLVEPIATDLYDSLYPTITFCLPRFALGRFSFGRIYPVSDLGAGWVHGRRTSLEKFFHLFDDSLSTSSVDECEIYETWIPISVLGIQLL